MSNLGDPNFESDRGKDQTLIMIIKSIYHEKDSSSGRYFSIFKSNILTITLIDFFNQIIDVIHDIMRVGNHFYFCDDSFSFPKIM